jgi:hypothetical protein
MSVEKHVEALVALLKKKNISREGQLELVEGLCRKLGLDPQKLFEAA